MEKFFLSSIPCLALETLPFSLLVNTGVQSLVTQRITFHVSQWYNHLTTSLGDGKQTCPVACIQQRNLLLFPISSTGKKKSYSLYFDILRRLTGVMPHQMSWRYDMLTLMFNKAHLLQNLEASHIPPRLFYYYYFFLNMPSLRFSRKETLQLYSWELSWHGHLVHILLSQFTNVADKWHMGL